MSISIDPILVELPNGIPSEYYIASLGSTVIYGDREGIVNAMAEHFANRHPAETQNIKIFNRETLTLEDVPIWRVSNMVHKATKKYLKDLVDSKI